MFSGKAIGYRFHFSPVFSHEGNETRSSFPVLFPLRFLFCAYKGETWKRNEIQGWRRNHPQISFQIPNSSDKYGDTSPRHTNQNPNMSRITQQQLESFISDAASLLHGSIEVGDYKKFIFPLLLYKRICDVFDEENTTAMYGTGAGKTDSLFPEFEKHRFQIPQDAHWHEVRKAGHDVGLALQKAMRTIEDANPQELRGIFGDAQWAHNDQLPADVLRKLILHFSTLELTVGNLPEDELVRACEYLVEKVANSPAHADSAFYNNRTVVDLMTEMLDVQPDDSVYAPVRGLFFCLGHLERKHKGERRNVKLYSQERNSMTSSIARMIRLLQGNADAHIKHGNTPAGMNLVMGNLPKQFDIVLADLSYSIELWNNGASASASWSRAPDGTLPQSLAAYALQQHTLNSLKPETGRCAILCPSSVLFGQEEAAIRRKLIDADLIECVIALAPNIFGNAPVETCIIVCRTRKSEEHRGKILFINAADEFTREGDKSVLTPAHIARILDVYHSAKFSQGVSSLVSLKIILLKKGNLSVSSYVGGKAQIQGTQVAAAPTHELPTTLVAWIEKPHQVCRDEGLAPPVSERVANEVTVFSKIARETTEADNAKLVVNKYITSINKNDEPNQIKEATDGVTTEVPAKAKEVANKEVTKEAATEVEAESTTGVTAGSTTEDGIAADTEAEMAGTTEAGTVDSAKVVMEITEKATVPASTEPRAVADSEVTTQVTQAVKALVKRVNGVMTRDKLRLAMKLKSPEHLRKSYVVPALRAGMLEMTSPDKPNNPNQSYRLTANGLALKARLKSSRSKSPSPRK